MEVKVGKYRAQTVPVDGSTISPVKFHVLHVLQDTIARLHRRNVMSAHSDTLQREHCRMHAKPARQAMKDTKRLGMHANNARLDFLQQRTRHDATSAREATTIWTIRKRRA